MYRLSYAPTFALIAALTVALIGCGSGAPGPGDGPGPDGPDDSWSGATEGGSGVPGDDPMGDDDPGAHPGGDPIVPPVVGTPASGLEVDVCVPVVESLGGVELFMRGLARVVRLDVTDPDAPVAFVGTSVALEMIDVSDPSAPVGLARLALPGAVTGIALDGDALLVVTSKSRLHVLDRTTLAELSVMSLPGPATDLELANGLAWIAAGGSLVVVDRHAEAPVVLRWEVAETVTSVAVFGDRAALALGESGLLVVDVADPAEPTVESWLPVNERSFDQVTMPTEDVAYLGVAYEGVWVLHLSGDVPNVVSVLEPIWDWLPEGMDIQGSWLAIGDRYPNAPVRLFDISEPLAPVAAAPLGAPADVLDVDMEGGLMAVANDTAGLMLVDISAVEAPAEDGEGAGAIVEVGRLAGKGAAGSVVVSEDGLAWVADGPAGVRVVDTTTLELVTTLPVEGGAERATLVGHYLYAANTIHQWTPAMNLRVFDVSDLESPELVWEGEAPGRPHDLHVLGQTLVIGGSHGGVTTYDVSDPAAPVQGEGWGGNTSIGQVTRDGNRIYVGHYVSGGASVVVLGAGTEPGTLEALGSTSFQAFSPRVAARDGWVVAAGFLGDVHIIDATDPSAMTVVGTVHIGSKIERVTRLGDLVILSTHRGELGLDISDPSRPRVTGPVANPAPLLATVAHPDGTGVLVAGGAALLEHVALTCDAPAPSTPAADAEPAPGAHVARLLDVLPGGGGVTLDVANTQLSPGFSRVSPAEVLVPPGDHEATLQLGSGADALTTTLALHATHSLHIAYGTAAEPGLLSLDEPVATPGATTIRFVHAAATIGRADALLAGEAVIGLGSLLPGEVGPAVLVADAWPTELSVAVPGTGSFVTAVPDLPAGEVVHAVLAVDPAGVPFVVWLDRSHVRDALGAAPPHTSVRFVHAAAQLPGVRLSLDGNELFDGAALAPLTGTEGLLVPAGALHLRVQAPGGIDQTFDLLTAEAGERHTIVLLDDGAGGVGPGGFEAMWYEDFDGQQTQDDSTRLRVLNAVVDSPELTFELLPDGGSPDQTLMDWTVPYGEASGNIATPPTGSYWMRVTTSDGEVGTFDLHYLPDYGNVLYATRDAEGHLVAAVHSPGGGGPWWVTAQERLARLRVMNTTDQGVRVNFGVYAHGSESDEDLAARDSTWFGEVVHGPRTLIVSSLDGDVLAEVELDLAPHSRTTAIVVATDEGHELLVSEDGEGSGTRVRLVNVSDGAVSATFDGVPLGGQAVPRSVQGPFEIPGTQGEVAIDTDLDGVADLTFAVDVGTNVPVAGLYFYGDDVPMLQVHHQDGYLVTEHAPEATAHLGLIVATSRHFSTDAWSEALGFDEGAHTKYVLSDLPLGWSSVDQVTPGTGEVFVSQDGGEPTSVSVELAAGDSATVIAWGDPAALELRVIQDATTGAPTNTPSSVRLVHVAAAFGAVAVAAESGDGELTVLEDALLTGEETPILDIPPGTSGLLLDYDGDGVWDWRMFGLFFGDPATVLIHGDDERAAMAHFGPLGPMVSHVGEWLTD